VKRSHRGIRKNEAPPPVLPDEALAHFACGCSNGSYSAVLAYATAWALVALVPGPAVWFVMSSGGGVRTAGPHYGDRWHPIGKSLLFRLYCVWVGYFAPRVGERAHNSASRRRELSGFPWCSRGVVLVPQIRRNARAAVSIDTELRRSNRPGRRRPGHQPEGTFVYV
jgi:hypothetical protein